MMNHGLLKDLPSYMINSSTFTFSNYASKTIIHGHTITINLYKRNLFDIYIFSTPVEVISFQFYREGSHLKTNENIYYLNVRMILI